MRFANRMQALLQGRGLLKVMEAVDEKEMITFAGGFPSPETYPMDAIQESFFRVLKEDPDGALSYSSTRGDGALREEIAARLRRQCERTVLKQELIVTNGSQQALDLTGRLFLDKGDIVIFESPSYLGALNALKTYEPEMLSTPTDEEGICIEPLRELLDRYGERVKLIYVIPDFQNPTGRCWSKERRRSFMELVQKYDVAILEDAAYSELYFDEKPGLPLISLDKRSQVVHCGTFSKVFCPGIRIGWIYTGPEMLDAYLILKNNVDLSSAAITQKQMADYLRHNDLDVHIAEIRVLYRERRDAMAAAIRECFPASVRARIPEGGLFFWVELPEGVDATMLLRKAEEEKVSFVPGEGFYPHGERKNEFRMNFSNLSPEEIRTGIGRLGRVITEFLK